MPREDAKQRIAEECGAIILDNRKNKSYCRFNGCEFQLNLLKRRGKQKAGFFFYSNVDVFKSGAESEVKGPWLREKISSSKFFEKSEYDFPTNRSPQNDQSAQEGYIACFYLGINWEDLEPKNLDRIHDLYERLLKFQEENQLANPEKVAEAIRTYNMDNRDEVERYLEARKKTANARTDDVDEEADKSNKKGTSGMNKEIQSLLEANLNVILTGAPGTGKTYTAKEVAKAMVGAIVPENATDDEKKWAKSVEKERIESVQFHPGYDYSDFVVGMKPVLVSKGGGKEVFKGEKRLYTTDNDKKDGKPTDYTGETDVSYKWKDGIFKEFADKAKADLNNDYVFLIDEINRADLSRVFGELFSLLEEDYRYPNDKGTGITLPNGEYFVIPKNLYILGTMNDIDRSVESMDFALRRRFAWYEVKPEEPDSQNMDVIIQAKVDEKKISPEDAGKLDKAMKALNKLIAPPQKEGENGDAQKAGEKQKPDLRLGSEYQLGGAIFAKYEKYAGRTDPFGQLWSNHIENILKEYLRGRSNRVPLLEGLKKAYDEIVVDKSGGNSTGENGVTQIPGEESEKHVGQE